MLFKLAMYWRVIWGAARVGIGIALWQVVGSPIISLLPAFLQANQDHTLGRPFFTLIHHTLSNQGLSVTYFFAIYCIFWGAIDVVVSIAMLKHQIWAFSSSIVLITIFLLYESFRVTQTHSILLLTFIIIDTGVLYLIYREYQYLKKFHLFVEELEVADEVRAAQQ